ncbi:MAG: hypothetical protein NWE94_03265 [Candidatus Bathyarchaeota archaeon]|nr:hypothetical protein [Candidatus Bathyarchaeota archaeon]
MDRLIVKSVKVTNKLLEIEFDCTGKTKRFFSSNRFFAEYSICIDDVPETILLIPFLSTVCPVAWANQADVYVETMDKTFLQSLEKVRLALQNFYPLITFRGKILSNKSADTLPVRIHKGSMSLFSGGVDSLATFIRHEAENPVLVAVHGSDVHVNDFEGWRRATTYFADFLKTTGATFRTIRSNFHSLVDELMIKTFYKKLDGRWWRRVMHGLAYLGLCAPLTYLDEIGTIYIASTFTKEFHKPWGSCPEIDNNVAWTGTKCVHDGFGLSRQQKLQVIAEYVRHKCPNLPIRVCGWRGKGANCSMGKCEKCGRTIIGLELVGLDPNNHGFRITSNTFSDILTNLKSNKLPFGDDEVWMWTDLQRHARHAGTLPHPEARALIDWLAKTDVARIGYTIPREQLVFGSIVPLFKYLPYPLCRASSQMYNTFKISYKRTEYKLRNL